VQAGGVLDLATVLGLRSHLQQALDGGAHSVVLDLMGVRLMDSSGLGAVVWLYKQLRERCGQVCVAATTPVVLRVFELTSVNRLIRIYDSVEAAEDGLCTVVSAEGWGRGGAGQLEI
jgi:anti-sigma B factor antagonist